MSVFWPAEAVPSSVDALATKALAMLGTDMPTADSILRIAVQLAELVNKIPSMTGPGKTALVQQVLRDILKSPIVLLKVDAATLNTLRVVIDTIVPTALTLIISAGRGEFDLKKMEPRKALLWCCSSAAAAAVAYTTTIESVSAAEVKVEVAPVAVAEVKVEVAPVAVIASTPPTESTVLAAAEPPVAPSSN